MKHLFIRILIQDCLLIKKDIFKTVGNYDEGMKLGYEDW